MRKIFILVIFGLLFLNLGITRAAPIESATSTSQSKLTVVAYIDPLFQGNQKAFNIIKEGLRKKFGNADIVFLNGSQDKSPAFLDFMDKIQTDPLNEKGLVVIKEGHLHKFGKDTNSKFVLLLNLGVTNRDYEHYWTKLTLIAYDIDAAKPIAIDAWAKGGRGGARQATEGAEYYMTKLQNEFNWPRTIATSQAPINDKVRRPAVVVFLPDVILDTPEIVQKIRNNISSKFNVDDVPIYIDNMPKSPAFLDLINRVRDDSRKQGTIVARKEYLSEYGKRINANLVIPIIISLSSTGFDSWKSKTTYRFKEEILVIDPDTNQYISSTVYDTEKQMVRIECIDFLMNKMQKEFVLPEMAGREKRQQ
jgi:hypothetical protein